MFEPWQMREMRPCPRQIREICSCARAAAGLEGAAGAGRGPAQNTLQTTQSQWLRPASIAGQSVHERARSAPRKNWGICAFPRNFRPVGANARNLAARANPRNLGAVSPPYYPPRMRMRDGGYESFLCAVVFIFALFAHCEKWTSHLLTRDLQ